MDPMAPVRIPADIPYRLLAENAADGVILTDAAGLMLWASASCERLLGWSPEELVGHRVVDFYAEEDLPAWGATVERLAEAGATVGRGRARCRDGIPRWMSGRLTVVGAADEYIVLSLTSMEDEVQARESARVAQARLAESEERFRLAMDNSAVGMTLVDATGRFLRVNRALCALFGRDEAALTSSTWQELTHPDDLDVDLSLVGDVLGGTRDSYRLLKRFLRPDGSVVWGDLTVSCVRDSTGQVQYFISQIVDMTAQHEAIGALESSEAELRLLAENSTDVVVRSAARGGIEWVSPSVTDVLGWRPEDLLGRTMSQLMHPDDLARVVAEKRAILDAGGSDGRAEARFATADGGWRWMSDHGRAIRDAAGEVIGGIDALRDIQAEHDASSALSESERHYRELSARLSASQEELRGIVDTLLDPWVRLGAVRDSDGRIIDFVYLDANDAACRANETTREELVGKRLLELLPDHNPSGLLEAYAKVVDTGDPLVLDDEPFISAFDGVQRRFDNRAVRVGDGLSFTWRDVTARYQLRQNFRDQAYKDLLTGVANRRQLETTLDELLVSAPSSGTRLAILYCDVDHFKDINDEFGHAAGDTVLAAVATAMRGVVRDRDVVARMGGDEFVVILDAVRDASDAIGVAEKLLAAAREPVTVGEGQVCPRVSVGVTLAGPGDDPAKVLARADRALYEAKSAGRDRVVLGEAADG